MEKKSMKDLTRRSFIKGAALGAGALAIAGIAGAKEAYALPVPKKWDKQTDILVAGAGGAGLAAAIWARKAGADVICLEKAASPMGSSTAVSAGGFSAAGTSSQKKKNIEDSFDLLYNDIIKYTDSAADKGVTKMYSELSLKAYEWLMGLGVSLVSLQQMEGQSVPRQHWLNASQMMQFLQKEAAAGGVKLFTNTAITNLIVNDKGRVVGVRAKDKTGEFNVRAKRAVVLACGGFAANLALCGEFGGPELGSVQTLGSKGNTGEGMLMALSLGAATKNMFGAVVNENLAIASNANITLPQVVWDGGILVNKKGKRFMRESRACFEMGAETIQQPDQTAYIIWDSAMRKGALTVRKLAAEEKLSGGLLKADSLKDLAGKLKIDEDQLGETVRKYNDYVEKGADPDFGRTALAGTQGKTIKLTTPPFYGVQIFAKSYWTKGGLKTDDHCRVLTWDNKAIPGLYAAGEIMFGNMTSRLLMMGTGVGGAITFGMNAGQYAATEKPQK